MNVNILCLVRFGSGRNKFAQLQIRAWNIYKRTIRTRIIIIIIGSGIGVNASARTLP